MKYIYSMLIVALCFSCSDSEFAGYNGSKQGQGNGRDNGNGDPNGTPNSGGPGGNTTQGGDTPTSPSGTGWGWGFGGRNRTPNNNSGPGLGLAWGNDREAWHIGNDEMSATSCKVRVFTEVDEFITRNNEKHTANFYFTVHQNNTTFEVIANHCGSDDRQSEFNNFAEVLDMSNNRIGSPIKLTSSFRNVFGIPDPESFGNITVNQGTYKVRFHTSKRPSDGDWDDLVVSAKLKGVDASQVTLDKNVRDEIANYTFN